MNEEMIMSKETVAEFVARGGKIFIAKPKAMSKTLAYNGGVSARMYSASIAGCGRKALTAGNRFSPAGV